MPDVTRRAAMTTGLLGAAAACAGAPKKTPFRAIAADPNAVFAHGVASGDPDATSVVIWSRISGADGPVEASWQMSRDEAFTDVVASGQLLTGANQDHTVKALVNDLAPGDRYFYRFQAGGATSPTGRTRTLPLGALDAARFAVISCSNYPFGFFNVYDQIAREENLNAVIHLGDYIYEYGPDGYGGDIGAQLGRAHAPAREIISLADYRTRHAQYKSDPSSQMMLAAHPLISVWDDHETSNDSWKGGAENHQPDQEGDWNARRRAALQAYYEWMPVRDPAPGRLLEALFRTYSFGDLLTLVSLETRLMARARQFEYNDIVPILKSEEDVAAFRDNILTDPTRDMLGDEQLDYVKAAFLRSAEAGQPWRLLANQVIMAEVTAPDLSEYVTEEDIVALEAQWDQARSFVEFSKLGLPTNLDAWDGYPAARERLYRAIGETAPEGLVVLTGDTHTWWANDLKTRAGDAIGVELGVTSVTSPSPYSPSFLGGKGAEYALLTNRDNDAVRYLSGSSHGYIALDVERDTVEAKFMAVDAIDGPDYNAYEQAGLKIGKSRGRAAFSSLRGVGFREQWLF